MLTKLQSPIRSFHVSVTLSVIWLLGASVAPLCAQARGVNRGKYRIQIRRSPMPVRVDGVLDEDVWSSAETARDFRRVTPDDQGDALSRTEVKVTYDDSNLYVGIVCYDARKGKRIVESLRRDFSFGKSDNFIVFIDTYNDLTNGFAFGVSAAGAQWDGSQANGGFVSLDWDTKWKSAVREYPDRWEAEFGIPFRSMRYQEGVGEWGINFSRLDLKINEKSSWAPMPRNIQTANLGYAGTLVWDTPPGSAGLRYSLIPYVSGKTTRDNRLDSVKHDADAGLDAKLILSTSMNVDLTLNPDYSQVDVDTQQTNLDRFELFFPEKRRFFLENSDLFANLGTENLRPFFSRRIGLDRRVDVGARLSGNLGNDWRVGLMDVQVAEKGASAGANLGVAVLQRKIFRRSNLVAFVVNRQPAGSSDGQSSSDYNRVAGFEYNLASADNRWTGKTAFHRSFFPGASGDSSTALGTITYATRSILATWSQARVGEDYRAELGYIRRHGYHEINPSFGYKFLPRSGPLISHGPSVKLDTYTDLDFSVTDRLVQLGYAFEWQSRDTLSVDARDSLVRLDSPFDPTNTGGVKLASGTEHRWRDFGMTYLSDSRKLMNYGVGMRSGSYYNGSRRNFSGELHWRVQPFSNLGVVASYDRIALPAPYSSADLVLIGPKLDLTFTDRLFLTTYVQYISQVNNLNVNVRFQWRFAPVSDLFVVYTDNSDPRDFQNKDRGLAVKVSYWFN